MVVTPPPIGILSPLTTLRQPHFLGHIQREWSFSHADVRVSVDHRLCATDSHWSYQTSYIWMKKYFFWNQKNWHYCRLSPTRPNKQRQRLNLCECFIQNVGHLRRQWVCTLSFLNSLPFYKEKSASKGNVQVISLKFRGKVNQIEAAAFFHLCMGFSPWRTMAQVQTWLFSALLQHEGGTACGFLESVGVTPSVPGTMALTCIDY